KTPDDCEFNVKWSKKTADWNIRAGKWVCSVPGTVSHKIGGAAKFVGTTVSEKYTDVSARASSLKTSISGAITTKASEVLQRAKTSITEAFDAAAKAIKVKK